MKRRLPVYMCDSLGSSNQARVHFLGIGSQLRGAEVPRVIKHSQPVADYTSVVTANISEQEEKPCQAHRERVPGMLPLRYHIWSSWGREEPARRAGRWSSQRSCVPCMVRAHFSKLGLHQQQAVCQAETSLHHFPSLWPVEKGSRCRCPAGSMTGSGHPGACSRQEALVEPSEMA